MRYRIHLEQRLYALATINLCLAAVRRLAYEAADSGLLSPELAAGIRRVKEVRRLGVRIGNWLTGCAALDWPVCDSLQGPAARRHRIRRAARDAGGPTTPDRAARDRKLVGPTPAAPNPPPAGCSKITPPITMRGTMILPGETAAGSAGMQPCRGIAWWAHRDDHCICANILPALLPTRIGSIDPHALKTTARRTESTLPESFPSSR